MTPADLGPALYAACWVVIVATFLGVPALMLARTWGRS